MDTLIHRDCPSCGSDQPVLLFELRYDQFVAANPTHNHAWFETLGFANDAKFNFVKCSQCDFVYSESRLNDKLNYQFYHTGIDSQKSLEKIFSLDKKLKQIFIWHNLLNAFSLHGNPAGDFSERNLKVLDFGAGWGDFLATVKSSGIDVFGLEFDRDKIRFACSNGISVGNMEFIIENAPYDIFCCNQVLEHLDKPKESLKQLKMLLNQNAVGFISVPNFSSRRMDQFVNDIQKGRAVIKEINPWGHLNYFTPVSLRQMIVDSEFSEIQTPLELETDLIAKDTNKLHLSIFQKFIAYQYKAFSTLLGKTRIAKPSSGQHTTSVFIKN